MLNTTANYSSSTTYRGSYAYVCAKTNPILQYHVAAAARSEYMHLRVGRARLFGMPSLHSVLRVVFISVHTILRKRTVNVHYGYTRSL